MSTSRLVRFWSDRSTTSCLNAMTTVPVVASVFRSEVSQSLVRTGRRRSSR